MSRKLAAVIAGAALAVGVLLGAVGAAVAGDGAFRGMMGSGGDFQCDTSQRGSHMTTEQMSQMMGGSFGGMMGSGMMGSGMMGSGMMGSGMGAGMHSQHHGVQP